MRARPCCRCSVWQDRWATTNVRVQNGTMMTTGVESARPLPNTTTTGMRGRKSAATAGQGKSQLRPPAAPCYPVPRAKIHARGNTGVSLWADMNAATPLGPRGRRSTLSLSHSLRVCACVCVLAGLVTLLLGRCWVAVGSLLGRCGVAGGSVNTVTF